ncbi:extracellular solute-binding protein [Pseudooceanicola sp. 216_PA32_1]|uniref:sn-glycerol-3-phosphate-binding periplasmic protein UgpB n=1 Tax=Pseudooceanicola pacificus TaxID=2676438 RepID=A0A844WDI5_9RHOB|nr:extracellular solute-binding protein [Pseudooceanicola pacificus]MWB76879.1 extracellular solute-binding protein [Pseudooceanicola pacificus]
MQKSTLSVIALCAAAVASPAAAEKTKFEYWYGLDGYLGEVVQQTCARFNESQDDYEITCVGQGGYATAVQNTIAAFRANQHPTIVQAYDAGTADLMLSGQFYPVQQMMADFDIDVDWDDYFPGISNYYASSKGELFSMPFNSSTAVMYINYDDLKAAGIDTAPATWEEFDTAIRAIKANGKACPYAYAPDSWVDLEQFSMAHNVPVASNDNGYSDINSELLFNTTLHVRHMEDIIRWKDEGLLQIRTTQGGLNTRDSFAQGECSFYFGSIAGHQTVTNTAPADMTWGVAMLPVFEGTERHNTVVGGASLWVLAGKTEEEYRGAAAYLKFLATPESEKFWASNTGYIPVTRTGFESLVEEGFYNNPPYKGREVALESLTYTKPNNLTRGIRLGGFIQIRSEWNNEVQAALAGQKTMQEALDTAVARGNAAIAKFARTYKGKQFP